ncbi:GNAT family N-acetyltransferase [Photobacterium carnosum]|uniref:GNAT family N-acetyltransferase n=1 Tax=Photobacterium carnosum TaxID=2023717 RepID=UPI001E47D885|nr:GNAT family N-acetyltransferase [Photobacterium carnosum]MCD9500383.1 GNAT family N-acetyltransferase [Photobacterium carnosum]
MTIKYKEDDGDFYVYLEGYTNDCYCMWRKNVHEDLVYSIERLDVLPQLRRDGIARKLLNAAIEHIRGQCRQACIEISAQPDEYSEITTENLVVFYESAKFEIYQKYLSRTDLRLYLDTSIKPEPLFDSLSYFEFTIRNVGQVQ